MRKEWRVEFYIDIFNVACQSLFGGISVAAIWNATTRKMANPFALSISMSRCLRGFCFTDRLRN